ncbi:cytochrome c biogenesis protein CcsA [Flavobacterium sp.]|uniref:cytochrome c biogenesis protein CcsA n=1 Tax=Flavobacterium sp. TaxID=239 RepID=UPI00263937CA|nr:cytochrome c biogenesis protein CcsA [Flavobacterium sp.]MDD2986568.1 cytochrome c biogenesis protein CcsA [Flavobacterium sp.]
MDKKIYSFLFSTRLMASLFIIFAVAMAIGTFIESYYDTDTARIWIYNAWWFEVIMVFFAINFIGNIKRYRLWKKEKWATLLVHFSFIFILVGAFITRYISFEGLMPIREGATEKVFYSDKSYLTVYTDGVYQGENKRKTLEKPLILSQAANNSFSMSDKFDGKPYKVIYKDYIMNGIETIQLDENGQTYLKVVESSDGNRHEHFLESGKVESLHGILFAFNKPTEGAINIMKEGEEYVIKSTFEGDYMRMADKLKGTVVKDSVQPLMFRSLYNIAGAQFVLPDAPMKGKKVWVSNNDWKDTRTDDILIVEVEANGKKEEVSLVGAKGKMSVPQNIKLGDLDFTLIFGSKVYELPFGIKLNDFIAKRYPGTVNSYSAFESLVTVIDGKDKQDAHIFMNNILDYKGYRFFQAQFDQDEKGTILSVNHDFWGTWLTYIGYFLLYIAMMAILFDKNTRFADIKEKLEKVKKKKAALLTIVVFFFIQVGIAQEHQHERPSLAEIEKFIETNIATAEHAAKFGRLVIQDEGGRMKPVNTFSSELLRKVSKSDHYKGYNSDQVFLSMSQTPNAWFEVPLIFLKRGNDSIRKILNLESDVKLAPFISFFDDKGNYKLAPFLDDAYKATIPNQFQKDFIEVDKKVVILNSALSGSILRIFPIPNDANNKWISYLELNEHEDTELKNLKNILPAYMQTLMDATQKNDYQLADDIVGGIDKFQHKYGGSVRPSDEKISAEIVYNKYDIFKQLYYLYMLAGVLMLIFTIIQIFNSSKFVRYTVETFHILIGFFFLLHTLGLIARWYISGHAPWSDAYESMIYVGWATMFFGLAFDRKSKLTVASAAFVASMIMMIAHWNWMDPSIANLQPVLNSYWLMIHVAVIVASYGPFTLGMILGIVSLLLILLTNKKNKERMDLSIQEITYINELALTIGLVMLTIGNFLGGQWANESWGRYWGWDPKETWALVSIMVYAFVIHARFVPSLRGKWVFNVMSIFAFYSILMTYFGVNFYLTGLHSYASGDKVVTPSFIYVSVVLLVILSVASYFQYKKHYKK